MRERKGFVTYRTIAQTGYDSDLIARVEAKGGLYNSHLHLDRSGTLLSSEAPLSGLKGSELSSISLQTKHSLIERIHESELYYKENLRGRLREFLTGMAQGGTTKADSSADVTGGPLDLLALETLLELKREMSAVIQLRVGAYSPLGFRDDEPRRWERFSQAALQADFLMSLPERDDNQRYPEHIGFSNSVRRVLELGFELEKDIQIHVDQQNHELESGGEQVLEIMDSLEPPIRSKVWLVHLISPSSYEEARFNRLVDSMRNHDVGVIVCPSAAISMRQFRSLQGPTRNSIARVLELLAAGIDVRLGSDNFMDITSPAGTLDLFKEVFVLSHALRFFDPDVLSSLAAGQKLSAYEIELVQAHIERNYEEEKIAVSFLESSAKNAGGPPGVAPTQ